MGLAASQCRLLSLTARIHDVEYEAQSIQNAKLELATQEDQVYQDFVNAQNAQTIVAAFIDPSSAQTTKKAVTFNNLCSINRDILSGSSSIPALKDKQGRLIVSEDIADGYEQFAASAKTRDAYDFAMFMLFGNDATDGKDATERAHEKAVELGENSDNTNIQNAYNNVKEVIAKFYDGGYSDIYDTNSFLDGVSSSDKKSYENALAQYETLLYSKTTTREELYNAASGKENYTDKYGDDLNYYAAIYNQIQAAGSCISIDKVSETFGTSVANDSEWLTNMIEAGLISYCTSDVDSTTGATTLSAKSIDSQSNIGYTETTSIDSNAYAKAEAEYNYKLKKIDQKDKAYDLELSKIESERTALTTEYDSVKKVITDNIDRTFKIFS